MNHKFWARVNLLVIGVLAGVLLEARVFAPSRRSDESSGERTAIRERVSVSHSEQQSSSSEPFEATGSGPVIVVDQPKYDFGDVHQRVGSVTHSFVLRNTGTESVIIEKVRPACGCTVASLESKEIAPGSSTTLKTVFSLKGRTGPQNRAIFMETNDPENRRIRLALLGNVKSSIIREPSTLTFGRLMSDGDESANTGQLEIRTTDGFRFEVQDTRTSDEGIVAQAEEIEPGTHYRLSVQLQPSLLPEGSFSGWVRLVTNDEGFYHEIPVTIRAQIGNGGPIVVGDQPEIAGPTLKGGSGNLADRKGYPTIVVFWASWCGHCKREIPMLVDLYKQHQEQGLRVLGVNVDRDTAKAKEACDRWQVPFPNIHFPSDGTEKFKDPLSKRYEVRGIPAVYLLDRDGTVVHVGLRGAELEERSIQLLDQQPLAAVSPQVQQ